MHKEARIVSVVSLFPLPQYVVVLEDSEKTRLVPIWIGVNEGSAIALEMQGEKFPRPLTHDLIVSMLRACGAQIEKIVINDLKNNSYYALIFMTINGKKMEIDARPSDSLALAVRVHCPIFIDEAVLKRCPKIEKPITKDEIDKFKSELKNMTPEEFFKGLEETPATVEEPNLHPDRPQEPLDEEDFDDEDPKDEEDQN